MPEVLEAAPAATQESSSTETQPKAPETTPAPKTEPTFDRKALETRVAERLAKSPLNSDGPVEEIAAEPAGEPIKDGSESVTDDQTAEEQEVPGAEKKPEQPGAAAQPSTLPDAYVRSLKARGWSDEKIESDAKKFGVDFIDLAERIHRSRNQEIAEWAAAGRNLRDQKPQPQPTAAAPAEPKAFDLKELKERYGGDEPMVAMFENVLKRLEAYDQAAQQTQHRSQQAEIEMLSRQVDGFFGGKEMASYATIYGDGKTQLTPDQIGVRNKVLELADALVIGFRPASGRTLSFNEAMQMAHDQVSSDFREQAVRTTITQSLKKRAAGTTLKPTNRTNSSATNAGPKTRAEFEKSVALRLKQQFGG